jgi:galactokinase
VSTEETRALFERTFGVAPSVLVSAPARVNLIGEHTDYNGGEVLPVAIERRTCVAARPNGHTHVRAVSFTERESGSFAVPSPARAGKWWDYVAGVGDELARAGVPLVSCDVAVWSDVPAGAGLASSAALEVAAGLALARAGGADVQLRNLALCAQRAESEFVGVACGIMDQFASALAREEEALHLFCDTGGTEHVPFRETVLIFDTAVPRALRDSAFNARRAECERALELLRRNFPDLRTLADASPGQVLASCLPEPLDRRALHVAEETRRVGQMVLALRDGDPLPGGLLLASQESLRTNYDCSCAELDWFVERVMRVSGVRGARLTGAGWGGCAIAVGDGDALTGEAPAIATDYRRVFGREGRWWLSRAANGVTVEWEACAGVARA